MKKQFWFQKKNGSDNDTEIGPRFRFLIPKLGIGRTLYPYVEVQNGCVKKEMSIRISLCCKRPLEEKKY